MSITCNAMTSWRTSSPTLKMQAWGRISFAAAQVRRCDQAPISIYTSTHLTKCVVCSYQPIHEHKHTVSLVSVGGGLTKLVCRYQLLDLVNTGLQQ